MFNSLQQQPADKILALMQVYKEDPRENKIVGIILIVFDSNNLSSDVPDM